MIDRRRLLAAMAALPAALSLPRAARATGGPGPGADLARLPPWAFAPQSGGLPLTGWSGPAAARQVTPAPASDSAFWMRFVMPFAPELLGFGFDGGWARKVGFGPGDILRSSLAALPPKTATVLDLAPGKGAAVIAALKADGYAEATRDGVTALARGEDFSISLAGRDNNDPFGAMMGKASRVVVQGDTVLQAADWETVLTMASGQGTGHPALPAFDAALAAPLFGAATPLQGIVLADQAVLSGAAPGGGLPVWQLGLLVDLSDGPTDRCGAVFACADATAATAVAGALARTWAGTRLSHGKTLAEMIGPGETAVIGTAAAVCAAGPATDGTVRLGIRALMNAFYQRDLAPFGL